MGASGGTAVAGSIEFFNLAFINFAFSSLDVAYAQSLFAQVTEPTLLGRLASSVWVWTRVALGIGFVIFVHELGHFLAAKWCGVKVEKFYVGFDVPIKIGPISLPRTLGKFRWGETEYGLGTIPLGGYVKMLGQDDDPRKAEEEAKRIRQMDTGIDATGEPGRVVLDPRSFPAKPVWQRMVIISSGVVMNLITGVMFAMVAFYLGVPYVPAIIGDLSPGGPAYQAGIEPGGQVVVIGDLPRDDQLHFREMRNSIGIASIDDPTSPVRIALEYPDGLREYELPTSAIGDDPSQRIIGVMPPMSTKLSTKYVSSPGSIAATVLTSEHAGAQVIAVDGITLPEDETGDSVEASIALQKHLQQNVSEPVTLTLRKFDATKQGSDGEPAYTDVEVTIPPQKLKLPGVRFAVGPVKAIVQDGAAAKAGVQVGDQLIAVDGDRTIDAFGLASAFANVTIPTTMTFKRGDGEDAKEIELTITPSSEARSTSPISEASNIFSLDRFEFAYEALPFVASVDPAGDKSESSLQPGDELKSFAVRWLDGKVPDILAESDMATFRKKLAEGWELNDTYPLSFLISVMQWLPEGTEFVVMASRDGKIIESKVNLVATDIDFADRGIGFVGMERTQYATSFNEALTLGVRESRRRLGDVFSFLRLAVQGKVQAKQLGGPIRIFSVAGSETSRGMSPLLMFLTMLSMNLAILNFLPIPALDGGHMLFLIAEAALGRPVDERLQMQLTMAGVLALLSLMAFAVFNDISQMM
jgi:regulator of sigma E protease